MLVIPGAGDRLAVRPGKAPPAQTNAVGRSLLQVERSGVLIWEQSQRAKPDQVSLVGQRTHGVGSWIRPPEKEAFELGRGSQLRLDRVEVGAELIAHALDGRNDRNRDAGGNQSVFDGGSARLISEKLLENDFQTCLLLRWVCPTGAIYSCCNLRLFESIWSNLK
jgi:hypothetical protein